MFDSSFALLGTELGLGGLALFLLGLDAFLPETERKSSVMGTVAFGGTAAVLTMLCFRWGMTGPAFGGSFIQDGPAILFKGIVLVATLFVLWMSTVFVSSLPKGRSEFVILVLFAAVGMLFVASSADFLLLFVSLEILTVSLYILTAYLRDHMPSIESGIKYVVLGSVSTGLFLYGTSFIYGATGSTLFADVARAGTAAGPAPASLTFGVVLVLAALAFKIAAFPFHVWAPDIYEGAPTPVTAFLATASKAAGFAAIVRLLGTAFVPCASSLSGVLAWLAALSMLFGNLGAIPQTNLKRLLAYSGIGHAGYLLIGLAAYAQSGREAVLFYLLSYTFAAAGAFLVLVTLSRHMKSCEMSELKGLASRSPYLAAGMMLSLLSLAGVPPLGGFLAKFYILWAGVGAGLFWLAVIGAVNVITSLYYYLKVVRTMYVDEAPDDTPLEVSWPAKAMQAFSMAGILVLGLFPGPFLALVELAFLQ